jgi:hypothetical protein
MIRPTMEQGAPRDLGGLRQRKHPQEQVSVSSSAPGSAKGRPWAGRAAWVAAAVVLLPLLGVGFLNDDFVGIVELGPRGWAPLLDQFHPTDFDFLRPLGFVLFRTELSLFGTRAWLFHASHLALFVLAAWLAGTLASRLARSAAAGWTAALALLYPGRTEAVAWIAAMFDLLALLLTSAALLVATAPGWDRRLMRAVWLASLCFVAPLAKESAYAIPFVVSAWELLGGLSPAPRTTRLIRCASGFAGAGLAFGYRMVALGGIGGYGGTSIASATAKALQLPEMMARAVFAPVNPTYGLASRILSALCIAATLVVLVGLLFGESRKAVRPMIAGLALALLGLAPALPYLSPATLVWSQSRFVTIAGLGVALAAGVAVAAAPRRWARFAGPLLLVAWTSATVLNELPWLGAARCRDVVLIGIERATRGPGAHWVWVAGPINDYRGAQLLGGRLAEAVTFAMPDRVVHVDSEFLQKWQHRPVGPPTIGAEAVLHVLRFDPSPPRVVATEGRPPAAPR